MDNANQQSMLQNYMKLCAHFYFVADRTKYITDIFAALSEVAKLLSEAQPNVNHPVNILNLEGVKGDSLTA